MCDDVLQRKGEMMGSYTIVWLRVPESMLVHDSYSAGSKRMPSFEALVGK